MSRGTVSSGRHWWRGAAVVLLPVMFLQLLIAATRLSATIDEGFHITSGYEYLRTGHLRLLDEHVPLAKALFAWPLFFVSDLTPPEQADGYVEGNLIRVAQETVLAYRPLDRLIVACRASVALLTLLLAATVCRWAADLFGSMAGAIALGLMAFDPNILAHGSLATTDLGATAFIFWAVWAFARYLEYPQSRRWWLAALLLGLAQGAKLTAALLVPLLGAWGLVDAWRSARADRIRAVMLRAVSYTGMLIVAALALWALYGFEIRPVSGLAGGILLPAASHLERWLRLQENLDYGRESFLLGQNRMHGWWQYFPVTFVLKTPIPTLVLVLCAVVVRSVKWRGKGQGEWGLLLFPGVYGALSLTSTLNIGYRHLLPILPFLIVEASRLATQYGIRNMRVPLYALLLWLILGTVGVAPHYLAYFNELAGGPDNGYRFLADSNTDWGQTLKELAAYQAREGLGPVRLSLFTFLDPAAYGVRYEPIAPMSGAVPVLPRRFNPEPGLYAISATTLDGVPLPVPSMYDWFRHRQPMARIGHVMFVYRVSGHRGEWVAQCTDPVVPLTSEVIAEGFGSSGLRQVTFDCTQSWLFPAGGGSSGWYVRTTLGIDRLRWPQASQRLEWWPAWVQRLSLDQLCLSYVQPAPTELPAFAIWRWPGGTAVPPARADVAEVSLDGVLAFLGYEAPSILHAGAPAEVLTFWRVLSPPGRPLSLMLHLSDEGGIPLAVGDGLGVPIEQWRAGDVIVQQHRLDVPADALPGVYVLRSGAYWLDDMTRLTADGQDSILLTNLVLR